MPHSRANDVTRILAAIGEGDAGGTEALLSLVYDELRRIAQHKMGQEPVGHTLEATALVHEAYLRLLGDGDVRWDSRGHFFAAAAEAMRRILVEQARRKQRRRWGGDRQRVDLDMSAVVGPKRREDLLALDEALEELQGREPRIVELIKLRYFAGLTTSQAADALGISQRTAERQWAYGRAWLYDRLAP